MEYDNDKIFEPTYSQIALETSKEIGKAGFQLMRGLYHAGTGIFRIPSVIMRLVDRRKDRHNPENMLQGCSYIGGAISGLGLAGYAGHLLGESYRSENPDLFYAAIATNIFSGIYELGRATKNRLTEKNKDLEGRL